MASKASASAGKSILLEYRINGAIVGTRARALIPRPATLAALEEEFLELRPTLAYDPEGLAIKTKVGDKIVRVTKKAFTDLAEMRQEARLFFTDMEMGCYMIEGKNYENNAEEDDEDAPQSEVKTSDRYTFQLVMLDQGLSLIQASDEATVKDLAAALHDAVYIGKLFASTNDMSFMLGKRELDHGSMISDYSIPDGAVVYLRKKEVKKRKGQEDAEGQPEVKKERGED